MEGYKHHLKQKYDPAIHMKVNCFANVKRRKGTMNKTAIIKLKWDGKEERRNSEYKAYVYITQRAVLEMFINNKCGMESWIAVILRLSTLGKNMDTMAYIWFWQASYLV